MSLPRKDLRPYFDHDIHAAIKAIADSEGVEPGAWIEQVIVGVVKKRVGQASLVINALNESGALGTFTDSRG
jgi:hypothetical protein